MKCNNKEWFTEEYGFFGEFYYISDNSNEGPYNERRSTREERTGAEVSLIKDLLGVKEKGGRLFDWPCGWGRHSLKLAEEGLNVTSLDINTYHLDKLKEALKGKTEKVQERVEIIEQDLRKALLGQEGAYDYGINMFSSFGFFSDEENLQVLQNFYDLLKPGGKLLIHLDFNAERVIHGRYEDYAALRTISFKGHDYKLEVQKNYYPEDKRLHGRWVLTDENDGKQVKEYSFRIYSESEWRKIMSLVGFTGVQFFNAQGESQTPQHIDTVILAEKPEEQDIKGSLDSVAQMIISDMISGSSKGNVFFKWLEFWWTNNVKGAKMYPWLKYINILSREDTGFFVSTLFDEPMLTHSREILIEKMVHGDVIGSAHSIGAVLREQSVYSEIYELIVDRQKSHLLESWIDMYSWIRPDATGDCIMSEPLKRLLNSYTEKQKNKLIQWTQDLSKAYTGKANEISHFFYLTGPTSFNYEAAMPDAGDDELRDYIVRANVGIKLTDRLPKNKTEEELRRRKREVAGLLKGLQAFVDKMTVFFVTRKLNQDILKQASRSAIAQAFARNKSHNLGSHVLTHCTKPESFVNHGAAIINRGQAYQGINELSPETSFPEQLAVFFSYISNRDAYISESTYGISSLLATKHAYQDLFKGLDQNRILLNHISGLDRFRYKFTFRYNEELLGEDNDIAIAFPGDALGMQAFYNILENLVRNTAKHNGSKGEDKEVDFTVDFWDLEDFPDDFPDKYDYYCVEVSDNITQEGIKEIVKGLRGKINGSILDLKTRGLRSHSLGLLEMEASAAFLRQVDLPEIESEDYSMIPEELSGMDAINKPYLLQAFAKDVENDTGILAYRFYVKKPKMYLVITRQKIEMQGVDTISPEEFVDSLAKGKYYNHEFAILDNGSIGENSGSIFKFFKEQHRPQGDSSKASNDTQEDLDKLSLLPHRLMKVDSDFIEKNLSGRDAAITSLEEAVWSQWIKAAPSVPRSYDPTYFPQIVLFNHLFPTKETAWCDLVQGKGEGNDVYGEVLSSNAQKKLPKVYDEDGNYVAFRAKQLWEAYDTCVLAIDERIQDFAEKNYGSLTIQEKAILSLSNVIIPDKKECDLAAEVYKPELVTKIEAFIGDRLSCIDFLLIHYGILERMYPDGDVKKQKMWEWSKGTKVIVTTGRGKHSLSLPEAVGYVNLPTVLNAFVDNRNKYTINHILNQARR